MGRTVDLPIHEWLIFMVNESNEGKYTSPIDPKRVTLTSTKYIPYEICFQGIWSHHRGVWPVFPPLHQLSCSHSFIKIRHVQKHLQWWKSTWLKVPTYWLIWWYGPSTDLLCHLFWPWGKKNTSSKTAWSGLVRIEPTATEGLTPVTGPPLAHHSRRTYHHHNPYLAGFPQPTWIGRW